MLPGLLTVFLIGGGYLLGAIPFAYIISKFVGHVDIRTVGSGNVGATNVARALGFKWAAATFLLDALKGTVFVLILYVFIPEWVRVHDGRQLILLVPVLGHCFSPFLKFKGGKGVATTAGIIAVTSPLSFITGALAYGVGAKLSGHSFIGSFTALVVVLALELLLFNTFWPLTLLLLTALLLFQHRSNLQKLLK